ncbi:uncharacterized protein GLRG_11374 [Colletotrichum graminicola M1.001]|uniref:Uncharacterized protein n=1 Tax=Colletotrichum graminicola (strain M1.001 / M2 / FGSC 10212) TaxID=645133 RepID=E3QZE1_COLGM|nr:uncharacterized protein GLRG_11374 [Colletotrichum graminicola M1.001]EFQ36229.1 hypothetical protein GLRG_11374 [Colletotrichum graminicola M1.001]
MIPRASTVLPIIVTQPAGFHHQTTGRGGIAKGSESLMFWKTVRKGRGYRPNAKSIDGKEFDADGSDILPPNTTPNTAEPARRFRGAAPSSH